MNLLPLIVAPSGAPGPFHKISNRCDTHVVTWIGPRFVGIALFWSICQPPAPFYHVCDLYFFHEGVVICFLRSECLVPLPMCQLASARQQAIKTHLEPLAACLRPSSSSSSSIMSSSVLGDEGCRWSKRNNFIPDVFPLFFVPCPSLLFH